MYTTPATTTGANRPRVPLLIAGTLALAISMTSCLDPAATGTDPTSNPVADTTADQDPAEPRTTPEGTSPGRDSDSAAGNETDQREPDLPEELTRLLGEYGDLAPLDERGADTPPELEQPAVGPGQAAAALPHGNTLKDPSTQTVFDIDLFEQNVRATLEDETVGYSYSIGKSGQLHSQDGVGDARTSADGQTDQSATKPMTVASISKPITAVAALRVMEDKGISVDDPIGPWLPSAWERGEGVDEITFRDLMTHRSGLRQAYEQATGEGGKVTAAYDNIKLAVSQDLGSTAPSYANMNFGIFRLMLPKMLAGYDFSGLDASPWLGGLNQQVTAALFDNYVSDMLATIGVDASCAPSDANPTMLYRFPDSGASGWETPSYVLGCGGYGYYVSANGLTSFLSHLRYTDQLLSPESRTLMNEGLLGWQNLSGEHGTYYGHGGSWGIGTGAMHGCVMSFPIHVDVALLINSQGGDYATPCTVLSQAFDNAWVPDN